MKLRTRSHWSFTLLIGAALTACESLLDVQLPTQVPEETLNNPALAPVLVRSAITDFECAFGNYVLTVALLTDELWSATQTGPFNDWDRRRNAQSGGNQGCLLNDFLDHGVWAPLQTARYQADQHFRRIQAFNDRLVPGGKDALLATLAVYAGYTYTLFGEGFCEAAFDVGPLLAARQVLDTAHQRFDTALALAGRAGADTILNMARVGRARVRLDLAREAQVAGDAALAAQLRTDAAADAALVPEGFGRHATYSSAIPRRNNPLWDRNYFLKVASVDPRFRNPLDKGVADPRMRAVDAGRLGSDGLTPVWYQTKYSTIASPIVIASWAEAQLIIAEAEGGQSAVDRINALRTRAGLPAFSSTGPDEIERQIARERRAELYLEGHRLNDRLRLGPLFTAQERADLGLTWETGQNHKGQTYGRITCLRIPAVERDNNPNI